MCRCSVGMPEAKQGEKYTVKVVFDAGAYQGKIKQEAQCEIK